MQIAQSGATGFKRPSREEGATVTDVIDWETCPFERPVTVRALDPPVMVEPPRAGEDGRPCKICNESDAAYLWTNERWRLRLREPTSLRGTVILETRCHIDSFKDFPEDQLAEFGPLVANIELAILRLGSIARMHALRWGDGVAHFHMHFYPRPLGQLQLRGTFMEIWELLLPSLPVTAVHEAGAAVADALTALQRTRRPAR